MNKGHCIYVKNCKGLPKEVIGEKHKLCECKVQYDKNVGMTCFGWKGKHDVYMMTNCIADNISNVTRKGKVKKFRKQLRHKTVI